MKLLSVIEFFRRNLKTTIRVCLGVLAVLAIADAIPAIVDKEHAHTRFEHLPAFWSAFGFIACVLIVYVSKWFGHAGIMTREDYYDR
jgi:homoserine trans-succinylase